MSWPTTLYVATVSLGIFYTDNLAGPGSQPTWMTVNDGLPSLACRQFALDPFEPVTRQYVLLEGRTLYRRVNQGTWEAILTPTQWLDDVVAAPEGQTGTLYYFCTDASVPGRLWVQGTQADGGWVNAMWSAWSDDYGDTWTLSSGAPYGGFALYGLNGIKAQGDNVYMGGSVGAGGSGTIFASADKGTTWKEMNLWTFNAGVNIRLNPLNPDYVYSGEQNGYLSICAVTGTWSILQGGMDDGNYRADTMWFDQLLASRQAHLGTTGRLSVTQDAWTSVSYTVATGGVSLAPYAGIAADQLFVGYSPSPGQPHVIGVRYGDNFSLSTGIAGPSPGESPYTDSIPYTCGGPCVDGIQAVHTASIYPYAVAMPGYTGTSRGAVLHGDRASWESGYAHASDWSGSDSHHPVTTLGTTCDSVLTLSGQEVDIYPQGAYTIFAGPVSGVPAAPTFRRLLESDISNLSHVDLTAIHSSTSGEIHVIPEETSVAGTDVLVIEDSSMSFAKRRVQISNLPSGASTLGALTDVSVPSPSDREVLTWDGSGSKWIAAASAGGAAASDPVFRVTGALSTATGVGGAWICPRSASITAAYIYCQEPGSEGSTIVDVNVNGVSIFATSTTHRPTLAYDDADQVAKSGAPDSPELEEYDVISVDVDEVATGAEDLTVIVAVQSSGTTSEGGTADAEDVTYTPAVEADWDEDTDPGNVNGALDQLAERVDDLEGAGGGGDSTYTAVYGSRPAASNDGNLFLPSDGFVIERDTGTAWASWGPIFPLAGVADAPDTWVNQGSATVTTTNGGIYLYDPANAGTSYRIRKKAAPSTPYTITALLLVNHGCWSYPSVGIGWRQSSDGKLVLARAIGMGSVHNLALLKANNETTDVATYVDQALGAIPWIWLRITDDGTNRIVSFSRDGQNFIQMHSVGRTDFLTADEVCLFASSRNGSFGAGVTLLSWKET